MQRAANFPIERTLYIDAQRINYLYQKMESQGNVAYLWKNKIIMIFRFSSGKRLINHNVTAMLIPGRKADFENTTL